MRIYGNRYRKGDDVSNNRMAFWGVIPAPVRGDQTLTDKAKLLYADLSALADEKGYCWASNEYLAQLYKCGERTISRCISQLADLGFVRIETVPVKGGKQHTERRIFLGIFGETRVDKIGKVADFGEARVDKNGEATLYCNSYGITGMNKRNDNNPPIVPQEGTGGGKKKIEQEILLAVAEYAGEDHALMTAILDFIGNRASIKKPVKTMATLNGILRNLSKLSKGDHAVQVAMLEEATVHNWQTVYALKPDKLAEIQRQPTEQGAWGWQ